MKATLLKTITALSLATALSACSTVPSPERQAKLAEFRRTIPACQGTEECNAKWEAAQLWVVKNAGFKIQTLSNVLIETYNATDGSMSPAMQVTKEPLGAGKYQLVVNIWCANRYGCTIDTLDASLRFNKEIAAVKP